MKATLPKKASLRGKHNDTKLNNNRHELRGRINSLISSRLLDLNSLPLFNMPEVDEQGHLILNLENPVHRAWMED